MANAAYDLFSKSFEAKKQQLIGINEYNRLLAQLDLNF